MEHIITFYLFSETLGKQAGLHTLDIGAWIMSFGYEKESCPKNGELWDPWFTLG